jgi:HEAT repeat protein
MEWKSTCALCSDLRCGDETMQYRAARQLREQGATAVQAIPALVHAIDNSSYRVTRAARLVIKQLGALAISPLLQLIRSKEETERGRWCAAEQLADLGVVALPYIRDALSDGDLVVRMAIIDALPRLGEYAEDVVPQLMLCLHDPSLRHSVTVALAAIASVAVNLPGSPAYNGLMACLVSTEPDVRREAVQALEFLGSKIDVALPRLVGMSRDPNKTVQEEVAKQLRRLEKEKKKSERGHRECH